MPRSLASSWSAHSSIRLDAALGLALDFNAWQTLARSGLDDQQAVELTAALIEAALAR